MMLHEDAGNVEVLLNDEFSEEFDTTNNNFCIFASEFISHLREGNRRTQAIDAMRPLPFIWFSEYFSPNVETAIQHNQNVGTMWEHFGPIKSENLNRTHLLRFLEVPSGGLKADLIEMDFRHF